ncbi:leucyl aminopeptidase [Pseudomonas trivialis]|uniref:Probable cytosol aminopeptidase n=1 Tax=Pseudomonas trivialis TaxID=200450 RepID=A0A0R2ZE44_9PSED|nr:leucyl aminopeptidase [Pseudomonas trivialis]KRP58729.1 cytosol aminopeptidase [Pseudomonas trivialis]SDS94022.1 aminopeptidase A. Metallo peptidase. MEROPS family M17 [Pseudomonas trivialis]
MKFALLEHFDSNYLRDAKMDCIVVGVHIRKLNDVASRLDVLCHGRLHEALHLNELPEPLGSTLLLHNADALTARRILLVQLGDNEMPDARRVKKVVESAAKALKAARCRKVLWCLAEQMGTLDSLNQSVLSLYESEYRFDCLKSQPEPHCAKLEEVALLIAPTQQEMAGQTLEQAIAIGHGITLCRDLGNLPPNICTPEYLAQTARTFSTSANVHVDVLEQEQIQALGMNAFLCVARGSTQAPKLIIVKYNAGPAEQAPIVLVGKGITFDSGGISIKPGEAMDEMKYDMCGAASVLGTLKAIIEMELPLTVYGVIPTCENMPAGDALKPGDIITSMLGKTIEVLNTDAEGRLILCDALTYVEQFKPAAVIDIATLTGACVVALGHVHSGLFAREDALAEQLLAAASTSCDTVWRMPLDTDYHESLKSNFADLPNIGGRAGGCITAACFLENFTRSYAWAHLDIAGTAWKSGSDKGATGRPVRLLTQYLIDRCALNA